MTAPDAALVAYVALLTNGSPVDYWQPHVHNTRPPLTAEHLADCGLDAESVTTNLDPTWDVEPVDRRPARPRFEEFVHCACNGYQGPFLTWSPEPVAYATAVLAAAELVTEARRRAALTVVDGAP